jgi:hypothetical protein
MFYILAIILIILFLSTAIKVLREYERGVVLPWMFLPRMSSQRIMSPLR